jgi:hypothetical protein
VRFANCDEVLRFRPAVVYSADAEVAGDPGEAVGVALPDGAEAPIAVAPALDTGTSAGTVR